MPTYLLHGFRWDRVSIRVHIVMNDLEDAAPEWIVAPATSVTLLNSFYSHFDFLPPSNPPPASYDLPVPTEKVLVSDEATGPRTLTKKNKGSINSLRSSGRKGRPSSLGSNPAPKDTNGDGSDNKASSDSRPTPSTTTSVSTKDVTKKEKKPAFNDWSVVKLVEQYDPNDLSATSQPYAYVADYMVEVGLSASITEEIAKYEARAREEEAPLSMPNSPGTPATSMASSSGELMSPGLSAREIRRRSRRLGWFEKLRDGLQKGGDIGWFVVVCGDEERIAPDVETEEETDSEEDDGPLRTPRSAGLRGFFNRKKNIPEE